MRVCILCSCLEPGRHGIGDYSVKLAIHLERIGIDTAVMALSDPYILDVYYNDTCKDNFDIPTLRLPSCWSVKKRADIAKSWIDDYDPNWLSFQSCLFSFNDWGLPLDLRYLLLKIGRKRSWHVMFHELWLGEAKSDPLRDKILGVMQKSLISRIMKDLEPKIVFTSNRFYQLCLEKIDVKAQLVPLFSNIPLGKTNNKNLFNKLPKDIVANRQNFRIVTFFGSIFFSEEVDILVLKLKRLVENENRGLLITHLGRCPGVEKYLKEWQCKFGIRTYTFGECEEHQIAGYFRQIDCGLSTYPKVLFEKSGSITAMNLNELPVILLRNSFLKDDREFSWLKEVGEIKSLKEFINNSNTRESNFGIQATLKSYESAFVKKINKVEV